ncbi:MAG: hypothetical protein ILO34_05860 [Kiritimatiellae bacterium]|nr:hypothetical protein [Kiritimatiellia bacterium]
MKRRIPFFAMLVFVLAVAGTAVWFRFRSVPESPQETEYSYSPAETACALIAAVENPSAALVFAEGNDISAEVGCFSALGMECATNRVDGVYDIVFSHDGGKAGLENVTEDGVLVWRVDIGETDVAGFRKIVERFPCKDVHLWMGGMTAWLLAGRREAKKIPLDAMLDLFVREDAYETLASAGISALSDVFAGYAGTREDFSGAFEDGDLSAGARPEFFLTREIPRIGWIDSGDVDKDIAEAILREIRSMQVVRRLIVEGEMMSANGDPDGAVDAWMRAAKRNPNDLFIGERMDRLSRNATAFLRIGNVAAAAKCYETQVIIRPDDVAAVYNYGICLKKLGKNEMAKLALERAKEMGK